MRHSVQVCVYLGDEQIVDAAIGAADGDTLFPIFSVSKAVTAIALHLQAERGLCDYDAPVARYWPEYAAHGKEGVTVRQVLTHRAGVPQVPADVTPELLTDWDWMVTRLAEAEPLYAPGTANAYHPLVFGFLLGEVVRRTDPAQRPFATFVQEELCEPLSIDSFWFGVPAEVESRIATLTFADAPPPPPAGSLASRGVPPQVALGPSVFNRRDVQRGVVPAVGAVANARSVARFFALLAGGGELDGVRLLSEERVRSFLEPRPDFDADDLMYGRRLPVGAGGLWLEAPGVTPDGGLGHVLCHPGVGGVIGWADLDAGLAVAILHDRMFGAVQEHPFAAIGDAVRATAQIAAPL